MENNQTMKASETQCKLNKLLNDAKLHVEEAENQVKDWQTKMSERIRHLQTIEIIKGEKES